MTNIVEFPKEDTLRRFEELDPDEYQNAELTADVIGCIWMIRQMCMELGINHARLWNRARAEYWKHKNNTESEVT